MGRKNSTYREEGGGGWVLAGPRTRSLPPETRFPHLYKGPAQSLPGSPQVSQRGFSERTGVEELCKKSSMVHACRPPAAPGPWPSWALGSGDTSKHCLRPGGPFEYLQIPNACSSPCCRQASSDRGVAGHQGGEELLPWAGPHSHSEPEAGPHQPHPWQDPAGGLQSPQISKCVS